MSPCNCSKKTPPTGSAPTGTNATQASEPARTPSAAARAAAGTSTPVERPTQQSFTLTTSSGRTQTFGSKLEADAERARHGGTVRQVR